MSNLCGLLTDLGGWLGSWRTLKPAVRCLLLLGVVSWGSAASRGAEADPWAPGHSLDDWRMIAVLQQYPGFAPRPPSEIKTWLSHPNPQVRAAACLAVGRTGDAACIPRLEPCLSDSVLWTRRCALWALLQIPDPAVKTPLLKTLAGWTELERHYEIVPGCRLVNALGRLGLPPGLVDSNTSREERAEWVHAFAAEAWKVTFTPLQDQPYELGEGLCRVFLSSERSEIDAGETLRIRFWVSRQDGDEVTGVKLSSLSAGWHSLEAGVEKTDRGSFKLPVAGRNPAQPQLALPPNAVTTADLDVASPDVPGVYLVQVFETACPAMVRVRRNAAQERQVPELLAKLPESAAIETLAKHRVQAAVPPLIKAFRDNADGNNFATARALAEIGDPAAIPILLDHPWMTHMDVSGRTAGSLKCFGPVAYPEFEKRIGDWKDELTKHPAGLEISLELLGEHASPEAERAMLELVDALLQRGVDFFAGNSRAPDGSACLRVLHAALFCLVHRHAEAVVDAVWRLRDRPRTLSYLLHVMQRDLATEPGQTVFAGLARRAAGLPGDDPFRVELARGLTRRLPHLALQSGEEVTSQPQALTLLQLSNQWHLRRKLPDFERLRAGAIERVEAYFSRQKEPPAPNIQISLAAANYRAGRYEPCERRLREVLQRPLEERDEVSARICLGECLVAQAKVAEGERELQQALGLMKPSQTYSSPNGVYTDQRWMKDRLEVVATWPRNPQVTVRCDRMDAMVPDDGRVELTDGCAFFVDNLRRLRRWDPVRREGAVFGILPNPERAMVPLDRRRVFVAFQDGTVALYQDGQPRPVWQRPLSLSSHSFLSATAAAITAADEEGTLHALDPKSGKTKWTRRVPVQLSASTRPLGRSLVFPSARAVLVPDRAVEPRTWEFCDTDTGTARWSVSSHFTVRNVAIGSEVAMLCDGTGRVAAVSLRDGGVLWRNTFPLRHIELSPRLSLTLAPTAPRVYIGAHETIHALDAQTGETLWQWTWRHLDHADPLKGPREVAGSVLLPFGQKLYALFRWEAEGRHRDRIDVVLLDERGQLVFHEMSPLDATGWFPCQALVSEDTLYLGRQSCSVWESWRFQPAGP